MVAPALGESHRLAAILTADGYGQCSIAAFHQMRRTGAGMLQGAPIANPARMAFCIGGSSRAASRMILRSHAPSTRSRFARIEAKH